MAKGDGTIIIDTRVDTSGIGNSMPKIQSSLSAVAKTVKKIGVAIGAAFAVKKIADFGKECLELGSDLAEVQNVVDVTFSTMSSKVDEFAKTAAKTYGLSETMAKKYTGTFGAMAKAFGFTEQQAYDMSTSLTGLTGDVASFYNLSQEEAYTKLKSVFTGETESLKDLGVVMTQSALDQYAMANGFGKTTSAMGEQEKVALRLAFIQDQLSLASGDFARTSDSWANQVRIMQLQLQSLKATIGQGLINLFTPVIKVINTLLAKLATVADAFKSFTELITGKKSSGAASTKSAGLSSGLDDVIDGYGGAAEGAENLAGATQDIADATEKARKEQKKYLSGLDEINRFETTDSDTGSTGGGSTASIPSVSGSVDYGNLAEGETVIDKVSGKFDKLFETIKEGVKPAIDSLKQLWNEGLAKLGDFAWTALKDFYSHFLVPVGKWVLGEGIPRLVNALNDGLMKVNWAKINSGLKKLWDALAPFAINVGEGLLWFWENALVPLGTWTMNEIVPRFLDMLSTAIKTVNNVIEALKPSFKWFWDNVLIPIAKWTGGVFLSIWDKINAALKAFSEWCKENPQYVRAITAVILSFFAAFKVSSLIVKIGTLIKDLGGLLGAAKKIGSSIPILSQFVSGIKKMEAAGKVLANGWKSLSKTASTVFGAIGRVVSGAWSGIRSSTSTIWSSVTSLLSGIWSKMKSLASLAFQAVRQVVTNSWSNLRSATSTIWSSIVTLVNGLWGKMKSSASSIFGTVRQIISNAWSSTRSVTSSAWSSIISLLSNSWTRLRTLASTTFTSLRTIIASAFSGLKASLPQIWSNIAYTLKSSWANITRVASYSLNGLKNVLSAGIQKISSVAKALSSVFSGIVQNVNPLYLAVAALAWAVVALIANWRNMSTMGRIIGVLGGIAMAAGTVAIAMGALKTAWGAAATALAIGGGIVAVAAAVRTAKSEAKSMASSMSSFRIPYLATGAVIPPNAPFAAVLGDQRNGQNLEAPESLIRKIFREESGGGGFNGEIRIPVILDGRKIYEAVVKQDELSRAKSGKSLLGTT